MDPTRFDRLAVSFGAATTRRMALAGLLTGALAGVIPAVTEAAEKRRKRKRKGRGGNGGAETPLCFQGSPCLIKPGANLRACNLGGSDDLRHGNCQGCALSGANLAGADLSGTNLQGAILGDACLVGADLRGADVSGVLFDDAILCRTIMPDGAENNSSCDRGTRCCQTDRPQGGACGPCRANETCVAGACRPCDVCASGCPSTTVQAAVDLAASGATVVLCPGEYKGSVFINKDLTLAGVEDPTAAKLVGTAPQMIHDAVLTVGALAPRANVTVRNIQISRGSSIGVVGPGVTNFASLRLQQVQILNCENHGLGGGGIVNIGGGATLVAEEVVVTHNSGGAGGGIENDSGSVTLRRCDVSENTARNQGGGIANLNGVLNIEDNTLIAANTAPFGGGIFIETHDGTVTIIDSIVRLNKAIGIVEGPIGGRGGGIYSRTSRLALSGGTSIERNTAEGGPGSAGGGVFNEDGTVQLSGRARISLNQPDNCVNAGSGRGCPA